MGETIQGITFIAVGLVLVAILLRVLVVVHRQSKRVKELEMQMSAMEKIEMSQADKEERNG